MKTKPPSPIAPWSSSNAHTPSVGVDFLYFSASVALLWDRTRRVIAFSHVHRQALGGHDPFAGSQIVLPW